MRLINSHIYKRGFLLPGVGACACSRGSFFNSELWGCFCREDAQETRVVHSLKNTPLLISSAAQLQTAYII